MILPINVTEYADRCSGLSAGTTRNRIGMTTATRSANAASAIQPRISNSEVRCCASMKPGTSAVFISSLHRATAQCEQTLRALLNERDDQHENQNLGRDRADVRFHELADDAQAQAGVERPGELPDATEHHHHEGIDDVRLSELGSDVADLGQCKPGQPGDARPERKRHHVYATRVDPDARSHRTILCHPADE